MGKIRILYILLLAIIVSGCSQNYLFTPDDDDSNAISFGTDAVWTRGSDIGGIDDVDELYVYSYYINGKSWANADIEDLQPYFTDDVNTPFLLTVADDGSCIYDGGARYWPAIDGVQLSFYTYYPINQQQLTHTINSTTGKPEFSYAQSEFAGDNNDIVFAAQFDQTAESNNGVVNFDLEHILTKLSLYANITGVCVEDSAYTNIEYDINGITIYNLRGDADLIINADGSTSWVLDDTKSSINVTATQGVTLWGFEDENASLTTTSKSVMMEGKAIYVLPQYLADARTDGDAPTIVVRIRKTFDSTVNGVTTTTELTYESEEIEIPAASGDTASSWKQGTHYVLSFEFDISTLDEYDTPLTLRSEIYGWTETVVDVDVDPNIYIYANTNTFEVAKDETFADMIIYTNYKYELRFHKRKYELDGTSYTEAAGFTYYNITDLTTWSDSGTALEPVLLWNGDQTSFGNKTYEYSSLAKYRYTYDSDGDLYVESDDSGAQVKVSYDSDGCVDPTMFTDSEGWIYFAIEPIPDNPNTDFYYKIMRTTRDKAGLYTNSAIENTAYGVNKGEDDAVYIMRLNIEDDHLMDVTGKSYASSGDDYGYFYGKIGAEMLSNGGGLLTFKFKVTLKKEL